MDIERSVLRGLLYVVLLMGGLGAAGSLMSPGDDRPMERALYPVCLTVAAAGLACSTGGPRAGR